MLLATCELVILFYPTSGRTSATTSDERTHETSDEIFQSQCSTSFEVAASDAASERSSGGGGSAAAAAVARLQASKAYSRTRRSSLRSEA